MELNDRAESRQRLGKVNQAFAAEEEEQMQMNDGNPSEVSGEEKKKAEQEERGVCVSGILKKMKVFQEYWNQHRDLICLVTKIVLAAVFIALVILACILNLQRATGLLVLTLLAVFFFFWDRSVERYGSWMWEASSPIRCLLSRNWFWMRWVLYAALLVLTVLWLVLDTAKQGIRQVVSFFGLLLFVLLMLVFSKHPFRWSWQALISGTLLQFFIALLIFRTSSGASAVEWIANKVEILFGFTDVGSKFIFGKKYIDHPFAFKVMPVLLFLSSIVSVLYYFGFMPWLICKIGYAMQIVMGTTSVESVVAAGTIFLGQTESLILVRPYISKLTLSEIHAIITVGLAGISGTMFAAYISLGVKAEHVLTSTVMSAPASLAIAKIFWPETETSSVKDESGIKITVDDSTNVFEAASRGATSAVGLVVTIVVNLMVFISLMTFLDSILSWFGALFDCPQLSFSLIFSYVFRPLAFMMGVSWEDSALVAELIGTKTFLNELLAYQKMSKLIKLRKAGGPEYVDNVKQYISAHSEMIATYALCGFSNFASMGIAFGSMSNFAPDRQADIAGCGFRALIAGSVSCFMTACIAGVLYIPEVHCAHFLSTYFNDSAVTNSSQLIHCCTQLYTSVTVDEPWNITIGNGFSESSLRQCCLLTPAAQFNCSLIS